MLAFSAIKNNDKVGLILFTDRIEKFVPPKKGRAHILRIIRELISFEPTGGGTNIRRRSSTSIMSRRNARSHSSSPISSTTGTTRSSGSSAGSMT